MAKEKADLQEYAAYLQEVARVEKALRKQGYQFEFIRLDGERITFFKNGMSSKPYQLSRPFPWFRYRVRRRQQVGSIMIGCQYINVSPQDLARALA